MVECEATERYAGCWNPALIDPFTTITARRRLCEPVKPSSPTNGRSRGSSRKSAKRSSRASRWATATDEIAEALGKPTPEAARKAAQRALVRPAEEMKRDSG